jgi:hypothetical protein
VANALWQKRQEKLAAAEYELRRKQERSNAPPVTLPPPVKPAVDQTYQDVQAEIRRRIAERNAARIGVPAPARPATSTRPPLPPALPPRRPTVTTTSPTRVPPLPTPAMVRTVRPQVVEAEDRDGFGMNPTQPAFRPAVVVPPSFVGDQSMAALAPSATTEWHGIDLRALLATPNAARQAFLLKEILDRPLGERRTSGGHEDWF